MSGLGSATTYGAAATSRSATPPSELIKARYSCRAYLDRPPSEEARHRLSAFLAGQTRGPLGSPARFALVAASPDDSQALKGLGTYGFIKGATGFIVGAVGAAPCDLEDYGYLLEEAILFATGLGLGTCWLGGTFTRSSFAERVGGLRQDESMPAVAALGYPADDGSQRLHERETGDGRLAASSLFFDERPGQPMSASPTGFEPALEAVRMAPSASNKQPWRVVRSGDDWRFYLARTKGYGKGSPMFAALRLADLQRVDMGIAMCHFALSAGELGLPGHWVRETPAPDVAEAGVEYTVTWRCSREEGPERKALS